MPHYTWQTWALRRGDFVPGKRKQQFKLVFELFAGCSSIKTIGLGQRSKVPAQMFSAANAKRLLEIARRNSLRKEAGLPLLSVSRETRLMKSVEAAERFTKFSEAFRHRIRDKALARTRRWQNDPNWKPKDKWESITFEREVNQRLTRLFARIG
jgi:hypothetical protein